MSAPYTVEPMFYQPSKQNQAKIVLKRLTTKLEPEISRAQTVDNSKACDCANYQQLWRTSTYTEFDPKITSLIRNYTTNNNLQ